METKTIQIGSALFGLIILCGILLYNVAYMENIYEMWSYTAILACGLLLICFLPLKPFETVLIYFSLYSTLQLFNVISIEMEGTAAHFSFGGIMLVIILAFGGLACLVKRPHYLKSVRSINVTFLVFAFLLLISVTINHAVLDIFLSLKELGRIIGVFILFQIALRYSSRIQDINLYYVALFVSMIVPVIVAGFELALGSRFEALEGYNRVSGTFGIPNMFGMYLIFPMTALLILILEYQKHSIPPALAGAGFMILSVVLFFTYTRAAWLALVIGIILLGAKKYKLILPAFGLIVILIMAFFSLESLRLGSTGSSGRIFLWLSLLPTVLDAPVLGHGLGSMTEISKALFGSVNQGQNQYLLNLIENGFLGLFAFLFLIISLFRICYQYQKKMPDCIQKDLFFGYLANLLGIFTIAFFESNAIFQNWVWIPAGIFLGAALSQPSDSRKPPVKPNENAFAVS